MNRYEDYTEEFKSGYIAAIEQSRDDDCACEYWAPENEYQHGWNAGVRALSARDVRHELNAQRDREAASQKR